MDVKTSVDLAGQIASSQFAGFIILLLVVGALGFGLAALWGFVKAQILEMRQEILQCRSSESECRRDNRMLAHAVLDQIKGKKWEAKARAEAVLSADPTPAEEHFQPGVSTENN